jgi:hypothetical protein
MLVAQWDVHVRWTTASAPHDHLRVDHGQFLSNVSPTCASIRPMPGCSDANPCQQDGVRTLLGTKFTSIPGPTPKSDYNPQVFWLSFGFILLPTLDLAASYSTTGSAAEGAATQAYNAAIALYLIVWGFALLTFFIFTLKTNMVFAAIFFFVTLGAWILSGAYWSVSTGNYGRAMDLQKVSLCGSEPQNEL